MNILTKRGIWITGLGTIVAGIFLMLGEHWSGLVIGSIFAGVGIYQIQLGRTEIGKSGIEDLKEYNEINKNKIIQDGKKNKKELLKAMDSYIRNSGFESPDFEKEYGVTKEQLQIFVSNIKNFSESKIHQGHYFFINEKFTEAKKHYSEAITLNSKNGEAFFYRALAITFATQNRSLRKPNLLTNVYEYRDEPKIKRDIYSQILSDYNESIELDPTFYALQNRGHLFLESSNFELAVSDFTYAIKINPKFAHAYNSRAIAYTEMGSLNLNSGKNKLSKKQFKKAKKDFKNCIKLHPNSALFYNNTGKFYWIQKDAKRAQDNLNKSIKINPNDFLPYLILGKVFENILNDNKDALKKYDEGLRVDSKNVALYFAKGLLFGEKLANHPKAIENF